MSSPASSPDRKVKFKKPPQAPRRFKSSYMFFSCEKHKEIRNRLRTLGKEEKTTAIAKMVSLEWKALSAKERARWDELARKDKARYELERSQYTGPWRVPTKRRATKNPNAPKRPMSAFLSYAREERSGVRQEFPELDNTEVSRVLSQRWKAETEVIRNRHIEREKLEREIYKVKIAEWKERHEQELAEERQRREEEAIRAIRFRPTDSSGEGARSTPFEHDEDIATEFAAQYGSPPSYNDMEPTPGGYPPARAVAFAGNPAHESVFAAVAAAADQAYQQSASRIHSESQYQAPSETRAAQYGSPPSYNDMEPTLGGYPSARAVAFAGYPAHEAVFAAAAAAADQAYQQSASRMHSESQYQAPSETRAAYAGDPYAAARASYPRGIEAPHPSYYLPNVTHPSVLGAYDQYAALGAATAAASGRGGPYSWAQGYAPPPGQEGDQQSASHRQYHGA